MIVISRVNNSLWAKKDEKHGQYYWLPLDQHLEDTCLTCGKLWDLWLNGGQRQLIVESLSEPSEISAKQLVQFLGCIHDFGKATPVFQAKEIFPRKLDLDLQLVERLEKAGFTGISQLNHPSPKMSPHALAGQVMLSWYGVGDDIASIVGGHHGKPIDYKKQCQNQFAYKENYFQEESPDNLINQKWRSTQDKLLQWALERSDFARVEEIPTVSQPGQVILSGLLIMSDWIASNEDYFPLIGIDEIEVKDKEARFNNGWERWFKSFQWEPEYDYDPGKLYYKHFTFKPKHIQKSFSNVVEQTDNPGIFILEAPMGIGKTEAALVAAEQLASKTGRSGLFFGLPTQATSNGIFPRIYSWLKSIREEHDGYLPIRLSHGKAALNMEFSSLSRNINVDEEGNESIFVNEWFSGRKTTSLDDFVVGTVDQFLLLALKQKHLALRHLGFSKKIVVIDEVHSYDAYMSQYLQMALQWMGSYSVPVIILSATLAADTRKNLVESYISGKGIRLSEVQVQENTFQTNAYPLITYTNGTQIKQVSSNETPENKVQVQVKKVNEEDLHQLIDVLSKGDGVIGLIVNTVKRAQGIARHCIEKYGEDRVDLLHSNFIATDRVEKEEKLLNMIGKDAKRPNRKIIIGTQVIEQSLDIDFDVLISDLAPMDLLFQRVGRLHRHDIERPKVNRTPHLYVIGINDQLEFEQGSEYIYGGYLLARTQYFLPDSLTLPNDISPLVQEVYGDSEIEFQGDLQDKYKEMKEDNEDRIDQKRRKARKFRIARPTRKVSCNNTLTGWLNVRAEDLGEEHANAQVRDSYETIEVIALKKVENGYGILGEGIDLSNQIENHKVAKELAKRTLRLPFALSYPNKIDATIKELEIKNFKQHKDWQDQPWLRGSLGIVFDENNQYRLNGYLLTYNSKYGLTYEKEGENGEV